MITSKAKILCVDDDPDLLNIYVSILRSAGYEVLETSTGNECLRIAQKAHPDLILLDVVLPDISGIDVCQQIKTDPELYGTYVILISGIETSSEGQAHGLETGADGYIVRPITARELLARVQAMLRLKQAETAQREMNVKLNTLIDSIPDAIFFKDIKGEHILVNKAAERMTSLKKNHILGKTCEQILPPDLAEMCHKSDEEVIKRREPIRIEESMTDKKGETIFLDTIKSPIFNDEGAMAGFVGISRDITERKQMEEELRNSEERFRVIFDNAADGILLADPEDKRFYMANKTICQMLGYSIEEMIKLKVMDIHPEENLPYIIGEFEKLAREETTLVKDIPMKRKDGSIFYANIKAFSITVKEKKYLAGIFRDMTERKQVEEALKKSEERFDLAIKGSNDGLWDWSNVEGDDVWWSPRLYELLGYGIGEIKASLSSFRDILHPDDRERTFEMIRVHFENRVPFDIEYRLRMKSGEYRWFRARGQALWDENGKPVRMCGTISDINDRKLAEKELIRAKEIAEAANRAKSDFLANMSHELTSPLNSIIGFSQILQDSLHGELNDKQKEYVEYILSSGMHLLSLITDILDLTKATSGSMELRIRRFLLKDLLRSSLTEFNKEALKHNLKLSLDIEPDADIEIEADLEKINQILFNLLSNAVKYTPDGGSVGMHARLMKEGIKTGSEDSSVEISVTDNGIGIKPEDLSNIFQAFTQLESPYSKKYAGTGLGLALTKNLIELHGGKIWVESEFGKGSKFTFIIPLKQKG